VDFEFIDKSVDESAPPPPQISEGFLHFPNTEVHTSCDMPFAVKELQRYFN
jgi:hypothetical protein